MSMIEVNEINDLLLDDEIRHFLEQMDTWEQKRQELLNNLQNLDPERIKVLVLGKTGTGKSAIINGLTGVDLEYFKHPIEKIPVIDCVNPESRERIEGRTKIGHSGKSETKVPLGLEDPHNLVIYYDCCGFQDTQGAGDEIQNILYIQTLASMLRRVKVVLTIAEHTIMLERENGVFNEIEQITRLFANQDFLRSNLYLVVTKSRGVTERDDIKERLARLLAEDHDGNRINIKEVVESSIENDRIGLFPMPYRYGPIEKGIFQEIIRGLNQVPETNDVGQVKIEVSARAEIFVSRVFIKLQNCITYQLVKISKQIISQLCNKRIDVAKNLNEIYSFLKHLSNRIPSNFACNNKNESLTKIEILDRVSTYADQIIELSRQDRTLEELVESCQELKKYKNYLLELLRIFPESVFTSESWSNETYNLQRRISDFLQISEELNEGTLIFRGILVGTARINKIIKKKNLQNFNRVEIYCLNTLFLDEELTFRGNDLFIIAPTWIMYSEVKINLTGKDQENLPESENNNKDGEPGLPGGNSGNFVGIGTTFVSLRFLKLVLNGGQGGRGLDGKEGERGLPGSDGNLVEVQNRVETKRVSKEPRYGGGSLVYSLLTFNAKFEEVYESQGEIGGKGEEGGKGGCGGQGGRSGKAFIFIGRDPANPKDVRLEAKDGPEGVPGEGGRGGQGGQGGTTFRGVYVNDIVLPELRSKSYWKSKSIPKRVMAAPRSASRCLLHAAMMASHVATPVFLPVVGLFQLGLSFHLSNINSKWKQKPEECSESQGEQGESGAKPDEKNCENRPPPDQNNFDHEGEKRILSLNYNNYYSETQQAFRFKSLIKRMHIV